MYTYNIFFNKVLKLDIVLRQPCLKVQNDFLFNADSAYCSVIAVLDLSATFNDVDDSILF